MFDLPLLLAWSGSDPAAGCANRSCQSTDEGCADPHRVFLERGPSVAPQHEICTSEKPELISARYERRSLLITANQPFGEWGKICPEEAMTVAVVDRLVHHATIFEMNVESYRRRAA